MLVVLSETLFIRLQELGISQARFQCAVGALG